MRNTWSSHPLPSTTQLTRVLSYYRTAQPPTQIPTCGFRTPRKCVCFEKWRKWSKLSCKKLLPHSRNRTSRISATVQQIQPTIPWRMCWITSNTTMVSWCPKILSSANISSRRQPTILETQPQPYSPLSKNFSSLSTSTERLIHRNKPWILRIWLFTGQEISDRQFANGIAWKQSRGHS